MAYTIAAMTPSVRAVLRERLVWIPLVAALLVNSATWAYLWWFIRPTDELLILHYTIDFGIDFLGRWLSVFAVPLIGLLFGVVNAVIIWWFWQRMRALAVAALAVTLVIQAALGGVAILLVALNT